MITTIVAAVQSDGGIGYQGRLPWPDIAQDRAHFRRATMDGIVVMGRRTYDSLPGGPLTGRINVVLTSNAQSLPRGVIAARSVEAAIAIGKIADLDVHIIGGRSVYCSAWKLANRLMISRILGEPYPADTFLPPLFPAVSPEESVRREWEVTDRRGPIAIGDGRTIAFERWSPSMNDIAGLPREIIDR